MEGLATSTESRGTSCGLLQIPLNVTISFGHVVIPKFNKKGRIATLDDI